MKNNITSLRKAKGLSMAALGKMIGCTQQQIDKLEKSQRRLDTEWMDKISIALDCDPMDLVEFTKSPASKNSRVNTATAKIIGAIETNFSNMVRSFDEEDKYEITFRAGEKNRDKKFFGLIVEGGTYGKYPENSELIFNEIGQQELRLGAAESENNFIPQASAGKHHFKIGNKIITAELVKSIRSE